MKNGKLFSKVSLLDVLVLAVLILLAVAVVVRMQFFSTPEEAEKKTEAVETVKEEFIVTLDFQKVPAYITGEIFCQGDTIMQGSKKLGKVLSVEKYNQQEMLQMSDGKFVTVTHQNEYTYRVKVKATLQKKENIWCTLSGKPVANGPSYRFCSTYFNLKGNIVSVEKNQ